MSALLALLATILFLLAILLNNRLNYFKGRHISFLPWSWQDFNLYTQTHVSVLLQKLYDVSKAKGPITGIFIGISPFFLANDLNVWRTICIKDFDSFMNRSWYANNSEPLRDTLSLQTGEKWRATRQRLSPQFSSGKIKAMLPVILEISDRMNEVLLAESELSADWSIKSVFQRFSSDVIAKCGFGLDSNGLVDPNSEFVKFGLSWFLQTPDLNAFTGLLRFEAPGLCNFLGIKRYQKVVGEFYSSIVKQTVKYRDNNPVAYEDIIGGLIKMMKAHGADKLTEREVTAHSFVFLSAALETTSNSLNYSFYYLAQKPELQERLRVDVQAVLKRHDDQLTYEAIIEMKELEKFLLEIFRRHPISTYLIRKANRDYHVPNMEGAMIKKNELILIPVKPVQMDPINYPHPEQMDLERDFKNLLNFGIGPRSCIAERFAIVELKGAIANFLRGFRVTKTESTPNTIEITQGLRVMVTDQKFYLNIERL